MSHDALTLTIDGQRVEARPGMTILEACRSVEVDVPTLCHFDCLTPIGACRLCVVEIEGARRTQSACSTPVADGMIVRTHTDALHEKRRQMIELLFAERNHFCPVCPMSGQCELQSLAYEHGIESIRYHYQFPQLPADMTHPNFGLDHNRCILCTRCVRVCSELIGARTLAVSGRGEHSLIIADVGQPLGESSCLGDGTCVQVCPTGALFDKRSAYRVRPENAGDAVPAICPACSVGCGIRVHSSGHVLLRIDGDFDSPVNRGLLCEKGRYQLLERSSMDDETPRVRENGSWREATWEEALSAAADGIKRLLAAHGPESIGGVIGPNATNEAYDRFRALIVETIGSPNLDALTSDEWRAWDNAVTRVAGRGLLRPIIAGIEDIDAADVLVVYEADPVRTHPVIGMAALRAGGTHPIETFIVNGERTELERTAHHQLTPPTDAGSFVSALLNVAVQQRLMTDADAHRIAGDDARTNVEDAETPEEPIVGLVRALARAKSAVWIVDLSRPTVRDELPTLLMLAATVAGETPARVVPLMSGGNLRGAVEHGCVSKNGWRAANPRSARGAIVSVADWPNGREAWAAALGGFEFLVVHGDATPLMLRHADVWLPALPWAYESGTRINFAGRAQRTRAALASARALTSEVLFQRLIEQFSR